MEESRKVLCLCELMDEPAGIDCQTPRFSWGVNGTYGMQKAYRIRVALDKAFGACVWDSGYIESTNNNLIQYGGLPLESGTRYYYQIEIFCQNECLESSIETFVTGILDEERKNWDLCWVGGAGVRNHSYLIRWPFLTKKKVEEAAVFVASPNYYQLYLDGKPCGDTRLNNARTEYAKTLLYATYPMELAEGRHVLGIEIGNGWYAMEKAERGIARGEHLIAVKIRMKYADGSEEWIESSHENCFISACAPDVKNSIYNGETIDARKNQTGYSLPDFIMEKDKGWSKAFWQDPPGGQVKSQMMEPIRIMEERLPQSIHPCKDGSFVVDFGQNFAGWLRLTARGPAETVITMRFAELINEDGTINDCSMNGLHVTDTFILGGIGDETFEPKFTYHGFRYVQIYGLLDPPKPEDLVGCVAYSSVKRISGFHSGSELLNRFYQAMLWTEKSNLYGMPTDCPQRAERVGWLNDMTVRSECALYNYRLPMLYRKWAGDIRDTQGSVTGAISDTAPFCRMGQKPADPVSTSFLLVPWNTYCFYGDRKILEENYKACQRWAEYLDRHSKDGLVEYGPMGDWASPLKWCDSGSIGAGAVSKITPTVFMSSGYQYYNYKLLEKMAAALSETEDEKCFGEKAEIVKKAFLKKYYHEKEGYFCENSQACNAFPLYLGMLEGEEAQKVLGHLLQDIMETNHCHLTTGNLCSRYVVETLFLYGHATEAFALLTQTSYPSWGYMLENGATTLWERWEKVEDYKGVSRMASYNHAMTGAVCVCFHKYLAGIRPDGNAPGFRNAVVRPLIPKGLRYVKGTVETVSGTFSCEWRFLEEKTLYVCVQVPFNCTADIYLPVDWGNGEEMQVKCKGHADKKFEEVCLQEGKFLKNRVSSGRWEYKIICAG